MVIFFYNLLELALGWNVNFRLFFLQIYLEAKDSKLWQDRKIRVLYALANCGIQQKDFELASSILDTIFDLESSKDSKAKLRSMQGRLFLQLGDLVTAMKFFEEASKLRSNEEAVDTLIDKSFVSDCLQVFLHLFSVFYDFKEHYYCIHKNTPPCPSNQILPTYISTFFVFVFRYPLQAIIIWKLLNFWPKQKNLTQAQHQ